MTTSIDHTTRAETTPVPWRITLSVETLAYAVIFLAALALRWIKLGAAPLSPPEAQQAMAAWNLASTGAPGAGTIDSPLIFAVMTLSFAATSASNAAARFVPMLSGLALTLTPLLFRNRLGRLPTLLAAALLAIAPSAVATSRQVSGVGLSMLALLFALAAFQDTLSTGSRATLSLSGVALAVALLADFGTPVALLTILLGAGFMLLTDDEEALPVETVRARLSAVPWSTFLPALLITLGLLGTLFFLAPNGLGALADQLGRFVTGLARRPPRSAYAGLVLGVAETPLLVFGVIGAWLASQSPLPWQRFLAGWGTAAVLANLIYPGALPAHTLWSAVPLALLSAQVITTLFDTQDDAPPWGAWAHGAGFLALSGMLFASLSRYLRAPRLLTFPSEKMLTSLPLDLVMSAVWLIVIVFLWMTVASIWGARAAWRGTGCGFLALALMLAVGQSASLAFTRATSPYEPLFVQPGQPELDILVETAREVGEIATGYPNDADISIEAGAGGMLAWAMRDFNNLTFVTYTDPGVQSVMVITPADGVDPALGSNYVGQDFTIVRWWTPSGLTPSGFLRWVLYRSADTPPGTERVILWVREDVYRLVPSSGADR